MKFINLKMAITSTSLIAVLAFTNFGNVQNGTEDLVPVETTNPALLTNAQIGKVSRMVEGWSFQMAVQGNSESKLLTAKNQSKQNITIQDIKRAKLAAIG